MNLLIVSKIIGKLLMIQGIAMMLPLVVSLVYKEVVFQAFGIAIFLCFVVGFLLSKIKPVSQTIRIREGITIVTLGWVAFSVFGAMPFLISGYIPNVADALFETVSGFTTTGASILTDVEALPNGLLFWRSFTHWIGGMGILVFTVAILPSMDVGSFQMIKAESTGPISEKVLPKVKDTASILYTIYIGFTVIEIILLLLGGMTWFEAATHTFGTVGTGGFGIYNDSAARFSGYIQWILTIFMVISSVNFALYYLVLKGRWREAIHDEETRFFFFVVFAATILITIDLTMKNVFGGGILESLRHSAFQVGTIISTTGFATANFDAWPSFSKTVLFGLFFFGGCAGSTGGGPKSVRILMALKVVQRSIKKIVHPRAVVQVKMNGKPVREETISVVFGFLTLYALFMFIGTGVVTALEGISVFDAFMVIAATIGNVGPGFGVVGPTSNYSQFSDLTIYILSFVMLAGRLEIYTVIALMFPSFWKK